MQQQWAAARTFEVATDPARQEFLLPRDVRVSVRHAHVGTSATTSSRRDGAHEADARLQRAASVRVDAFGLPAANAASRPAHPEVDLRYIAT